MRLMIICAFLGMAQLSSAQETSPFTKFGKITVEDLKKTSYPIDTGAHAVVLADIGERGIEGNGKGGFAIITRRHRVVHILKKSGYDEADVEVYLSQNGKGAEEKLESVKAITYNLDNGKIVESKMDRSAVLTEKIDKYRTAKKFTFPNVKEGSIIEFEYKTSSDFISDLDPWYFQGSAPVLWSECRLSLPEFFMYSFLGHGYHPFAITDKKDRVANFVLSDNRTAGATSRDNFEAGVTDYRWVMKNVPELKRERFTSSLKNHISSIDFQLIATRHPLVPHDYRTSWEGIVKELSESEYFGAQLHAANNWLGDDLKPVMSGASSGIEKALKIYEYARDHYSCTQETGIWASQSPKAVAKTGKGTVSEINILLTAMLKYAGLDAAPVILSTTEHGYASETFPMLSNFNYVVSRVNIDGRTYFLDASHSKLPFGRLLPECYNGHARAIDEAGTPLYLSPDSLMEKKMTMIFVTNNAQGKWIGSLKTTFGDYESYSVRQQVIKSGNDGFMKSKQEQLPQDIKFSAAGLDSLTMLDKPVTFHADLDFQTPDEDVIYFSPLMGDVQLENPFKSAERFYPVEMPYRSDEIYVVNIEVPQGYVVDELPKQVVAKLDENNSAYFEYRISQSANNISLRCRVQVNKTLFLPEEYETLREFFALVVKKEGEQIVFKKKK